MAGKLQQSAQGLAAGMPWHACVRFRKSAVTDRRVRFLDMPLGLTSERESLRNRIVPLEEKRVLPRFPLEMPVWLRLPGSDATVHAKTRDVSASGVFFYVNCDVQENSEIEFTMTLPPELTRTAPIQVSCKGRVVRVQNDLETGRIGIAAAIHSYDFLAQAASSSLGDA